MKDGDITLEPPCDDDPASIRLAHLREESDVKSLGQLCYLVTFVSGLGTLEFLLFALGVISYDNGFHEVIDPGSMRALFWILTCILLVHTIILGVLGHGLTHLQRWARWTVVALTGLSLTSWVGLGVAFCFQSPRWGMLGLVIGIFLHVLIMCPLLTPGVGVVFSRSYKQVIGATPEIRSRMHPLLKLFIASLLAGLVGLAILITFWILG